jgi:hypothetical protein
MAAFLDHQEREFSAYACWQLLILEHWLQSHLAIATADMSPRRSSAMESQAAGIGVSA